MLRNFLWIGATIMALVFVFALPTSSDHGLPTHTVLPGKTLPSPADSPMPSNPTSASAGVP
jgi:hypothetical protein